VASSTPSRPLLPLFLCSAFFLVPAFSKGTLEGSTSLGFLDRVPTPPCPCSWANLPLRKFHLLPFFIFPAFSRSHFLLTLATSRTSSLSPRTVLLATSPYSCHPILHNGDISYHFVLSTVRKKLFQPREFESVCIPHLSPPHPFLFPCSALQLRQNFPPPKANNSLHRELHTKLLTHRAVCVVLHLNPDPPIPSNPLHFVFIDHGQRRGSSFLSLSRGPQAYRRYVTILTTPRRF